jgi:hypothetical protein
MRNNMTPSNALPQRTFGDWYQSLPQATQDKYSHDRWGLAYAAFEAGKATAADVALRSLAIAQHGGWVSWNGGVCPVPVNTLIHYRVRKGQRADLWGGIPDGSDTPMRADELVWGHTGEQQGWEIVAYRVATS